MALRVTVNGKEPGSDWLHASVAGRRFPAPVSVTNTGTLPVEVQLRMWPGSMAEVVIAGPHLHIAPGSTAETTVEAHTTSTTDNDTVLQVLAEGVVQAEFRFTAVSLLRESYFHSLFPKPR